MSFSNYIKYKHIYENYRKDENRNVKEYNTSNYKLTKKCMSAKNNIIYEKNNLNNRIKTPNFNNIIERNQLFFSFDSLNKKGKSKEDINKIYDSNDFISIYKKIKILLKNIILEYNNQKSKLCKILHVIYEYIYNLNLKQYKRENFKSAFKKDNNILKSFDNLLNQNTNEGESNKKINSIFSPFEKYKVNEFNYLLYINELNKKLFSLEQELNNKNANLIYGKKKLKLKYCTKFFSIQDLKIRNQSFTINGFGQNYLDNNYLKNKNEKNLKISLKDIFNDLDYENNIPYTIKLLRNKQHLLSHPKLNYNGFSNSAKGKISNIAKDKLNRISVETFGIQKNNRSKLNKKCLLYLSFNPNEFKAEIEKSNRNIKTMNS